MECAIVCHFWNKEYVKHTSVCKHMNPSTFHRPYEKHCSKLQQIPEIQVSNKQRKKCIHKIHCFHGPVSSKSVTVTMMPPLNIWSWPHFMVHLSFNFFPTSVSISPHLPLHLDDAGIIRSLNHEQYSPLLHDTVTQKQDQSIIKAWNHLQKKKYGPCFFFFLFVVLWMC